MKHASFMASLIAEQRLWCSESGCIYTLTQDGPFANTVHKKAYRMARNGYPLVTLGRRYDAVAVNPHQVIWVYFNRTLKQGLQINHKDGNKWNNAISNLEAVTPSQNILHSFKHGLQKPTYGEINGQSVLTAPQVQFIRASALPGKQLAQMFAVSTSAIYQARTRKTWRHLP